jgi:hypothetical protein
LSFYSIFIAEKFGCMKNLFTFALPMTRKAVESGERKSVKIGISSLKA